MSSIPLYKAFIEVGASEESATSAAEDVIQVSQLPQLATKSDIAKLEQATKADIARLEQSTKADIAILENKVTAAMASQEARLVKWMVGTGLLYTAIVIAGVSLLV